ncbi:MAG: amino acid deaminase/aldolase, partial [Bacteroidetes bacterium]|nr:amino acid deaminase/aldolase [Bacteroidota bacterium]
MSKYKYYKSIFKGQRMPLAYVDLDLMHQNIDVLIERAKSKNIRIASKSIRCKSVMDRILQSNNQFKGIMCFTAEEAVYLAENRFDDIILAYPVVHPPHIQAIANKVRSGAKIYLMVDRMEHIHIIEKALQDAEIKIPICIDIDMSVDFPGLHFGVWRSALRSMKDFTKFVDKAILSEKVIIKGLMGYEAQIAGVGDNVTGKFLINTTIKGLKAVSIPQIKQFRKEAVNYLRSKDLELDFVNGGGTGSMESTCVEEVVTEITVGSGFYNSHLFDYYSNFSLLPAAGFALQITRRPKDGIYTCQGGGYIASGGIESIKAPLPYLPEGSKLIDQEGAGEVQTPIVYKGKTKLKIGDPIFLRHSKAGELCERFNELYLIEHGKIVEKAKT